MSKYAPIYTTLWSGIAGKFDPFPINKGIAENIVAETAFVQLCTTKYGSGVFDTFAQEDRPMIRRVALFVNFADGMPIPRFSIPFNFRDFISIALKADTVGGIINGGIPIPALNTWFEVNSQIPISVASDYSLWGAINRFTFFTSSIDAAYNGSGVTFTLGVEVEHTFPVLP